jgi:hypothetical protein
MKKKSVSRSAFCNPRILIGLPIALAGVFLALAGLGAFSAVAQSMAQAQQKNKIITNSKDPLVPNGFDCSKIHELGIDKQMNFRAGAIMIACGQAQGGGTSATLPTSPLGALTRFIRKLFSPLAYGGTDVDLITGTETYPNIDQSTTFSAGNPDNPDQIVVAYNDSRGRNANPINLGGASVSTDAGNTFVRLTRANGQSPFDNAVGDPVVLYNRATATWHSMWNDASCGGAGIGGYNSAAPWDPDSWTHYCIHAASTDERESGWADNNPASPFYGRMYVSWNDSLVVGGAILVSYSTDNGLTWTNAQQITTNFIRNVQITGDLGTGDVYIAGMDEMGGGLTNRANKVYRSTDGGSTWTNTYTGPTFPAPGRIQCSGYWVCMEIDGGVGYWRYMGWGEPAAFNHVVHLVYTQHGAGSDPADVYYIRSTDSGVTFSAPFKLNTDTTTRAQWQPSLSVGADGSLFATWYDERETENCAKGNPDVPCYRRWGRKSTDNGMSWLIDQPFSDVVSPLPGQPDPGIVSYYAGDYDYGSSLINQHLNAWVDGRVSINASSQQDVFFDREPPVAATATPTPTPRATPTPRPRPTPPPRP